MGTKIISYDGILGMDESLYPGGGNGYHSRVLAWEIPWTEEPRGLQSMGS